MINLLTKHTVRLEPFQNGSRDSPTWIIPRAGARAVSAGDQPAARRQETKVVPATPPPLPHFPDLPEYQLGSP